MVAAGEPIWVDAAGVTCRRWNHSQCQRTRITEDTNNAYFVLDRLAPFPLDSLQAAADELLQHLRRISPRCVITQHLLAGPPDVRSAGS